MPPVLTMPEPRQQQHYGWKPDLSDERDLVLSLPSMDAVRALPPSFSLRAQVPEEPYDQGQLGSCTANGIGFLVQFCEAKGKTAHPERPSRLFIYYGERQIEGTIPTDSGAMIRDGMKVVSKLGAPPEHLWPYDISRFTEQPPQAAYDAGLSDQVIKYLRCQKTLTAIKTTIAQGFPVVFGFVVYESFEGADVARTGMMPTPQHGERVLGGHCTAWIGWDDKTGTLETRNSWGTGWGDKGYFHMPYGLVTRPGMCSDLWSIQLVESPTP